jgi:hypothetical protein
LAADGSGLPAAGGPYSTRILLRLWGVAAFSELDHGV